MRTFTIPTNPYGDGKLYMRKTVTFKPGVTVLVGCNGSGKTTLLSLIESRLKKDKTPYIKYDNLKNGGDKALSEYSYYGQLELFAEGFISSEGENIRMNMGQLARKIGYEIGHYEDTAGNRELWILLDAVDSGLSIDNIVELDELFRILQKDAEENGITAYVIAAANEYELVRRGKPFDVRTCKYIELPTYEAYFDFILRSSEKRYKSNITDESRKEKFQDHITDRSEETGFRSNITDDQDGGVA